MKLKYANVSVTDFDRARKFYDVALGLKLIHADNEFGYANFDTGPASLAIVRDSSSARVGRHTGMGWCVDDLDSEHKRFVAADVAFLMRPTKQPWGGYMSLFKDQNGNMFCLDQVPH
jgi:predicted enzyme related to lactoylglutathione lyase